MWELLEQLTNKIMPNEKRLVTVDELNEIVHQRETREFEQMIEEINKKLKQAASYTDYYRLEEDLDFDDYYTEALLEELEESGFNVEIFEDNTHSSNNKTTKRSRAKKVIQIDWRK